MQDKKYFYSQIRIFGSATFIMLSLVVGPLAGYFVGDFLVAKFLLPTYTVFICVGLGFCSAAYEIFKIIRFLLKKEEK